MPQIIKEFSDGGRKRNPPGFWHQYADGKIRRFTKSELNYKSSNAAANAVRLFATRYGMQATVRIVGDCVEVQIVPKGE